MFFIACCQHYTIFLLVDSNMCAGASTIAADLGHIVRGWYGRRVAVESSPRSPFRLPRWAGLTDPSARSARIFHLPRRGPQAGRSKRITPSRRNKHLLRSLSPTPTTILILSRVLLQPALKPYGQSLNLQVTKNFNNSSNREC